MNENYFSLTQKTFPLMRRKIEVDLERQKIKVSYKTLFDYSECYIDLYEVDENPQRISKKSIGWFIFSLLLSFYTVTTVIPFLWIPTLYVLTIPFALILLGACALSWHQYFTKSLDLLIYTSRFQVQYELFSLFANNADKQKYQEFVSRLRDVLVNRKGRDLRVLMEQTPIQILIEAFQTSYFEELLKRDVDVMNLLDFIQKHFFEREEEVLPSKKNFN